MSDFLFNILIALLVVGVVALIYLYNKYVNVLSDYKDASKISYYDSHTGLGSVQMFKDTANYIIHGTKDDNRLVILSFDLETLKDLEKLLGDEIGNLLLKEVISRIKSSIRSTDMVTRTDRGHFYIMLNRIPNTESIDMLAKRITRNFEESIRVKQREFKLNPFIGIASYPSDGKDIDLLINKAETARFKAYASGTTNYLFHVDESATTSKKYDIAVRDIKRGIENNEFLIYYQPLYSLQKNKIVGMEALVRWNNPEKGLIAPNNFIPIAETSGLIVPLGYWVLRESCRQFMSWGLTDLKLSVNLSAYQFKQKDLVQKIGEIIEQEGIPSSSLNLEITESTSMHDINYTLHVLTELRDMGLHLSIDDFGTGYSSLAYLKQFPITTLKIDRSFVDDITKDTHGETLIRTIISLAKSLELNVVAEGVETKEQLAFLDKLSCDKIQGYLLSPPLPSDKFYDFIHSENSVITT